MNKDGLRIYIKRCGTQVKAAALLEDVTPTRFNNWLNLPACHMRKTHAEQIEAVTEGEISCLALLHYLNKEDQKAVLKESKTGQKILQVPASALVLPTDITLSAEHRAYAEYCLSRLAKPPAIIIDIDNQVLAEHALLQLMHERGEAIVPVRMLDVSSLIRGDYKSYELQQILMISQRISISQVIKARMGLRQGQRFDLELRLKSDEVKGRCDDYFAKIFGFGGKDRFRQALYIYTYGSYETIAAVDAGNLSVNKAYQQIKAEQDKSLINNNHKEEKQ